MSNIDVCRFACDASSNDGASCATALRHGMSKCCHTDCFVIPLAYVQSVQAKALQSRFDNKMPLQQTDLTCEGSKEENDYAVWQFYEEKLEVAPTLPIDLALFLAVLDSVNLTAR